MLNYRIITMVIILFIISCSSKIDRFFQPDLQCPDSDGGINYISYLDASDPDSAICSPHGLRYNGGPVLTNPISIYLFWYGEWANLSTTKPIIDNFIENISNSDYWKINTEYCQQDGKCVSNQVNLAVSLQIPAATQFITGDQLPEIIFDLIGSNHLIYDADGVYFLLLSKEVKTDTSCNPLCAFHGFWKYWINNNYFPLKYGYVQAVKTCPMYCGLKLPTNISPNNDVDGDGMVSSLIHEIEEATSDPELNGWRNPDNQENADLCQTTYSNQYTTPTNRRANIHLNSGYYMVQDNWVNEGNGYCGNNLNSE